MSSLHPRGSFLQRTASWLASQQVSDGQIPWFAGGKMDPWDHVHAAMGLACAGRFEAARLGLRYLARTQRADGTWPAAQNGDTPIHTHGESNHAAYFATGLWYVHCADPDVDFLAEMWRTLERAVEFVLRLQQASGTVAWASTPQGEIWNAPLLTGSASIHGSLICALRVARRLGRERPHWRMAARRLGESLRHRMPLFEQTELPEPAGRHAMDWYYPVLGGALRGKLGRQRLAGTGYTEVFLTDGVGCRCVRDRPWYTVAESCELVIALDACGLRDRARAIFEWMHVLRDPDGAYYTGVTHPGREIYPEGERTTWTAATVLLAADCLYRDSATSDFFHALAGDDLFVEPLAIDAPAVAAE